MRLAGFRIREKRFQLAFAKVIIMGNLGKDPESFTYGPDKKTAARFSVAVSSGKGDDKKTDWFNCTVFGAQAKNAMDYLQKGKSVVVFGRLTLRAYESNGKSGHSLDVAVDDIQFTPGGGTGAAAGEGSSNTATAGARNGNGGNRAAEPAEELDSIPF
jgi:single-strand DNA-binding protein